MNLQIKIIFSTILFLIVTGTEIVSGQIINAPLNPFMVADINQGTTSSTDVNQLLIPYKNGVFFIADNGINGNEPWFSNGTAAGTYMLMDIYPGAIGTYLYNTPVQINNKLVFGAYNPSRGTELWVTDGTVAGTQMLPDIAPGGADGFVNFVGVWNNYLFFIGNTAATGNELYRTDGTVAGTVFLGDLNPGTASSVPTSPKTISNSNYLFYTGLTTMGTGILCSTDGTPGNTQFLPCFAGPQNQSSEPLFLTVLNNILYFQGYAPGIGHELWKSDGTPGGTVLYHEFIPGFNPASLSVYMRPFHSQLSNVRGIMYANSQYNSLYKLDGTSSAPIHLHTVSNVLYTSYSSQVVNSVILNNEIYFSARDSASLYGIELWKTNLNAGGTTMVKDIYPGNSSSSPELIGVVNNRVLMIAYNSTYGEELWRSNGTILTTELVKDISNGTISPLVNNSNQLIIAPNKFIFTHNYNYIVPWITDGTTNGTFKLINTTSNFNARNYFFADGNIFFTGYQNLYDFEIYVSNGTLAGTQLLEDINPPGTSSDEMTGRFVKSGNFVFFFQINPANGCELWAIRTSNRQRTTVVLREMQNDDGNDLVVYPSPAKDNIYIRFDELPAETTEIHLQITDITGKVVVNKNAIDSGGDTVHEIDVQHLPSGVYVLHMIGLTTNKTVKFVKQ